MPVSVQIQFPKADAEKLIRAMDRAKRELGISTGEGVRLASQYLVRSVAASTAVAPKRRPVEVAIVERLRILKSGKESKRPEKRKVWGVRKYIGNAVMWKPLTKPWPKNKSEANKHPGTQIGMRGLAKAAWWWAAKGVGGASGAASEAGTRARQMAMKYGHHEGSFFGLNPYAKMSNTVNYASAALKNGPRDVSVAMAKAASQLNLYVGRKLKEALG
jgi:hypothetical protein